MKNYHDLRYRDYIIYQWSWSDQWTWRHSDIEKDAPRGKQASIEDCMRAIDDIYLDEAHKTFSRLYPQEAAR